MNLYQRLKNLWALSAYSNMVKLKEGTFVVTKVKNPATVVQDNQLKEELDTELHD